MHIYAYTHTQVQVPWENRDIRFQELELWDILSHPA